MKTTIKVTTTKEVEVNLPQFRKDGNEYYAFYSEENKHNIYFRTYKGKLMSYHAFADISDITKGEQITQSEFIKAYNETKDTINIYGVSASVTNDEQVYNIDQLREDYGSTASEQTDDLGFQEFVKENY